MARKRRTFLENCPQHVRQRGVDRGITFRTEQDCRLYLGLVEELAPLFDCRIHAYVLMRNHAHMLITPGTAIALPAFMKHLGQRYAQGVNRRWKRTGPLWDDRYRANLVESETYALTCQRYIELNPVRAGMVRHPGEHAWSSFRHNAYGVPHTFLQPLEVFTGLGSDEEAQRISYRALFDDPEDELTLTHIRTALRTGAPLGSENFVNRIAEMCDEAMERIRERKRRRFVTVGSDPGVTASG